MTNSSGDKPVYKRLSEQVRELSNPQRSDTFIRQFRDAVREGDFRAIYVPGERFEMPKQFTRRGESESYTKDSKEMLFEYTPEFEEWFGNINKELAVARKGGNIKPTVENLEAGLVDFEDLARQTQEKMQASYKKGQQLGKSRAKKRK